MDLPDNQIAEGVFKLLKAGVCSWRTMPQLQGTGPSPGNVQNAAAAPIQVSVAHQMLTPYTPPSKKGKWNKNQDFGLLKLGETILDWANLPCPVKGQVNEILLKHVPRADPASSTPLSASSLQQEAITDDSFGDDEDDDEKKIEGDDYDVTMIDENTEEADGNVGVDGDNKIIVASVFTAAECGQSGQKWGSKQFIQVPNYYSLLQWLYPATTAQDTQRLGAGQTAGELPSAESKTSDASQFSWLTEESIKAVDFALNKQFASHCKKLKKEGQAQRLVLLVQVDNGMNIVCLPRSYRIPLPEHWLEGSAVQLKLLQHPSMHMQLTLLKKKGAVADQETRVYKSLPKKVEGHVQQRQTADGVEMHPQLLSVLDKVGRTVQGPTWSLFETGNPYQLLRDGQDNEPAELGGSAAPVADEADVPMQPFRAEWHPRIAAMPKHAQQSRTDDCCRKGTGRMKKTMAQAADEAKRHVVFRAPVNGCVSGSLQTDNQTPHGFAGKLWTAVATRNVAQLCCASFDKLLRQLGQSTCTAEAHVAQVTDEVAKLERLDRDVVDDKRNTLAFAKAVELRDLFRGAAGLLFDNTTNPTGLGQTEDCATAAVHWLADMLSPPLYPALRFLICLFSLGHKDQAPAAGTTERQYIVAQEYTDWVKVEASLLDDTLLEDNFEGVAVTDDGQPDQVFVYTVNEGKYPNQVLHEVQAGMQMLKQLLGIQPVPADQVGEDNDSGDVAMVDDSGHGALAKEDNSNVVNHGGDGNKGKTDLLNRVSEALHKHCQKKGAALTGNKLAVVLKRAAAARTRIAKTPGSSSSSVSSTLPSSASSYSTLPNAPPQEEKKSGVGNGNALILLKDGTRTTPTTRSRDSKNIVSNSTMSGTNQVRGNASANYRLNSLPYTVMTSRQRSCN